MLFMILFWLIANFFGVEIAVAILAPKDEMESEWEEYENLPSRGNMRYYKERRKNKDFNRDPWVDDRYCWRTKDRS